MSKKGINFTCKLILLLCYCAFVFLGAERNFLINDDVFRDYLLSASIFPAGTRRQNNVLTTSS